MPNSVWGAKACVQQGRSCLVHRCYMLLLGHPISVRLSKIAAPPHLALTDLPLQPVPQRPRSAAGSPHSPLAGPQCPV